MLNFTGLVRPYFCRQASRFAGWESPEECYRLQIGQLRDLLTAAARTEVGRRYAFAELASLPDDRLTEEYAARVPVVEYEQLRPSIMRMIGGEKNVLWPGRTRRFAQSSGTSGGKSKYIPITPHSLSRNHFAGSADAVGAYLLHNHASRLFSGKSLILGGSFANTLPNLPRGVKVGDLSATLIDRAPAIAAIMRAPDKHTALLTDWEKKLPELVRLTLRAPITSISGVPSWFLILLREVMHRAGTTSLHDVWPGLEVFFHGGISFAPYRAEYESFIDPGRMHFLEVYNASEGFFAIQPAPDVPGMLLLLDRGIYYEFAPLLPNGTEGTPIPLSRVEPGRTYALYISACNGLWRYSPGDTVRFSSTAPPIITIAGRTHSFINAFGEELMEWNAEAAMATACLHTGARVANYTAGPVYAADGHRGRHRWLIEFSTPPADIAAFAAILDKELRAVNSDYDAKRAGNLFLDPLEVRVMPAGHFAAWLKARGTGRLGGQRKVPRLCPTAERLADLENS